MGVAYLRESVTDVLRPFTDSPLEVRRRWYPVPDDTPLLGVPSVFLSDHWEPFPYLPRGAGEVYAGPIEYPRVGTPDGLAFDHVCNPGEIETGALFDPAVNTVYDDEWIPLCCGRESVCTTQLCAQEPVNDRPAAQLWSFAGNHQDATGDTPAFLFQRMERSTVDLPAKPGWLSAYYPQGRDGAAAWSEEGIASAAGVLESVTRTFRIDADNATTWAQDATGETLTVERGGTSGTLTFRIVAGKLEVCGTNAVVCYDILPAGIRPYAHTVLVATGTDQAGAAAIATQSAAIRVDSVAGAGVRLPADEPGPQVVSVLNVDATDTFKVYPATGAAFVPALVANAPVDIPPRTALVFERLTPQWWAVVETIDLDAPYPPPPPAAGTVTAVGISTSSAGVTVGVTDPTTTPALTVNIAADLDQLVGFPAIMAIPVGDGAGNWDALGIGAGLDLTAGVLSSTAFAPASGETVGAPFTITGASDVYQATGISVNLPAAGTYQLGGKVRGTLLASAAGFHQIIAKLRDVTNGVDLTGSETFVAHSEASGQYGLATAPLTGRITVTGPATVELFAKRVGVSWGASNISSDASGWTTLDYTRKA